MKCLFIWLCFVCPVFYLCDCTSYVPFSLYVTVLRMSRFLFMWLCFVCPVFYLCDCTSYAPFSIYMTVIRMPPFLFIWLCFVCPVFSLCDCTSYVPFSFVIESDWRWMILAETCSAMFVNSVNDQIDATITILLTFESVQHVSGRLVSITNLMHNSFTL
jgi:hypothetical protein